MAIVTVGNTKGGVGKSTTAIQLALGLSLSGSRVWLVDGDRQQTSLAAMTVRADSGRPTIAASAYADGKSLRAQVVQQRANYDHIVIDAGGRDSSALRAALTLSDTVLIPFLPRSFDVWALGDMSELVDEARAVHDLRAVAFLNLADSQGDDNREASAALADFPAIELLPFSVCRRKVYAHAAGAGLHVEEFKPRNSVACAEVDRLAGAVFGAQPA
jgi:chromosome partitioning protein